jgi:hypothetical protein
MQIGFDKVGMNKKIKELFIEKKQTCATMTSSIGSNIGDHKINREFDFDSYQEMKKYKINPVPERTIGESIGEGWIKLMKKLKCISD